MTQTDKNLSRRLAAFVFTVGFLAALLWTFVVFPRLSLVERAYDMNGYGAIGENLYRGSGFSLGDGPTLRRAPLYPTLIAGVSILFGLQNRENHTPLLVVQCLFAGFTCLAAYGIANRLFGGRVGLTAGLLCAVWPQCLRYLGVVEVEAMMTLLITLLTLAVVRLYQEPNPVNGALTGFVLGFTTLAKPMTLLFPLVILGLFLFRRCHHQSAIRNPQSAILPLAACLAVMAALCAPWIVRNHIVTQGRFHGISSNASGEFLRGYVNARPEFALLRTKFQGNWDIQANLFEESLLRRHGSSFWSYRDGKSIRMVESVENELRKEQLENRIAREMVLGDPLGFVRKFFVQLFTFWYLVETPAKSLLVGLFSGVALTLAFIGWRCARAQGREVVPIVATVLYFNIVYAVVLAFARYSMSVFPSLLALSANGLCAILAAARRSRSERQKAYARD